MATASHPAPGFDARRRARPLALACLALALAACFRSSPPRGVCPPDCDVILVSIDTLRADHLGFLGYPRATSPRLDAFAAQSLVFENAISQSAWTTPAHASMMTGLLPSEHGLILYNNPGRLNDQVETIAEVLRARGYRTAGFNGGGYVSAAFGLDQGFERYEGSRDFAPNLRAARRWLGETEDERVFLFLHAFDVHRPYTSPRQYDLFSEGLERRDVSRFCTPGNTENPGPQRLRYVVSQYDAGIRTVDDLIGTFLDELRRAGRLDRSLVVITSDHGDEFYEHGRCDHIHSVYDELVHVPLVIHVPGWAPQRFGLQVPASVAVMPTVLELLGDELPSPLRERSLVPLIEGHAGSFPVVVSETGNRHRRQAWRSVRTGRFKLVEHRDRERRSTQLYDLRNDPGEARDLAEARPELVAEIRSLVGAHPIAEAAEKTAAAEIDPSTRATLRALGYLQAEPRK